jgi:sugar lactone lactonase YvrE
MLGQENTDSIRPTAMRRAPKWAGILTLVLFATAAVLGLWVVRERYFSSLSIGAYLLTAWDGVSLWAGRIATISGALVPLLFYIFKRRIPVEKTWKEIIPDAVNELRKYGSRKVTIFPALVIVAVVDAWLLYVLVVPRSSFPMPPSAMIITPDGLEIYIADEKRGQIRRFGSATGKNELTSIDVGGHPRRMLIGPRSHNIYVLDSEGPRITVINPKTEEILYYVTYAGHVSNSFAITPDERKLYISNEQPSPQATITVVDLAKPSHPTHSITGFNCPEGLAITPDGSKVYVSTQCGAGHDPLFVIDTKTDHVKKVLADFAVGTADLAVARGGERVYVSRAHNMTVDRNRHVSDEPEQISVVDTTRDEKVDAEKIQTSSGAFTVSPDGKFLFFVDGSTIEIVNTQTAARRSVSVGAPIAALAVGEPKTGGSNLVCYAWCPEVNWIFFTGLTGLLP